MKQFTQAIKTFLFIFEIEILFAFSYLISIPVSASNESSGIIGFSAVRFTSLLILVLFFVLILIVWLLLRKHNALGIKIATVLYRFSGRKALLNLESISFLGSIIWVYLLIKWFSLEPSYEYGIALPRLLPIGFLSLLFFLQLYLIVFFPKNILKRRYITQVINWVKSGIPARTIMIDLFSIAVLLVVMSMLSQGIRFFTPFKPYLDFIIYEFYLDSEQNIPTYFSAFILLFSAFLLAIQANNIQKKKSPFVFQWYLLSCIFLYLAVDEVAQIHELLTEPVRNGLHTTGAFYFAWYIPVIPVLILLGIYYLKFLFSLPKRQKIGYTISGAFYILGVIGIEMIGSLFAQGRGLGNFDYSMIATLEEFIEMTGIILFIYFNWELIHLPDKRPVEKL